MRSVVVLMTVCAVAACDSDKHPSEQRAALSASAGSSSAPAPDKPRRQLPSRATINLKAVVEARGKVLAALTKVRALGAGKSKAAIEQLEQIVPSDPVGAVVAIEIGRRTLAAGDPKTAARFARNALVDAEGNDALTAKAQAVLDKAIKSGANDTRPSIGGPFATLDAACRAIVDALKAKKIELMSGEPGDVQCSAEYTEELGAKQLESASALRVESKTKLGRDSQGFVALKTPKGFLVDGPFESVFSPASYGLTNEFTLDLQHVDALPGASPEVVVRIDERRTLVDIALNEQTELDVAHVVLLTTDRGKLERSRKLMLSKRVLRNTIDPEDTRVPTGYAHAKLLGTGSEFEMKVAWGAANSITLTRFLGNLAPPDQGTITLFP